MNIFRLSNLRYLLAVFAVASFAFFATNVAAKDPIKIGFSMALTGGLAGGGKQALVSMEMWADDINAKGGILGRPVKLVYYDDQTKASTVPGIYAKLLDVGDVLPLPRIRSILEFPPTLKFTEETETPSTTGVAGTLFTKKLNVSTGLESVP